MFNIKKSRKSGECSAVRCTKPAVDLLCEKHEGEWTEAGKPALTSAEPGTSLAKGPMPKEAVDALDAKRHEMQTILARVQALPLETQEDIDKAGKFASAVKQRMEECETERRSVVDPINGSVKQINGWFKPIQDTGAAILKTIKDRVGARLMEMAQEKDAALKSIAASGGVASAEALLVVHTAPVTAPANFSTRRVFEFELVDATLVPEKYWTRVLNKEAIQEEIDALKGAASIPGIAVTSRMVSSVRKS